MGVCGYKKVKRKEKFFNVINWVTTGGDFFPFEILVWLLLLFWDIVGYSA